jgi:thiol-disulfide isomerase/thioredoxin
VTPRRRRIGVVAVVASLLAIQLVLVIAWRWRTTRVHDGRELAAGDPADGGPAPPLRLEREDGSTTALAVLAAGRPLLVHFWATWCPPCRAELPGLLAFRRSHPEVAVVVVAVDDDWPSIRRFLRREPRTETFRPARRDEVLAWGTSALPETWLVDSHGRRVRRWRGAQAWTSESAGVTIGRALSRPR